MPLEQRLAVLETARAANAWVIEDDFDGEYTFRGQPLPAMQGLDDESRVAANDLMFSDYNAQKFCDRMEAAAQAVAKDSSITKFTRS